jgi:hypothetical protein
MNHPLRALAASLVISAVLTQTCYAQNLPESARQKAQEAQKKAYEKATDEDYNATIKRTQDVNANQKIDPWGNLRPPPAGANK